MLNKRLIFIVNPISGGRKFSLLQKNVDLIKSLAPNAAIAITQYAGQGREIAASAVKEGYDVVIAAGGDGTVNEVASALLGTGTALGIVPLGSGNGLARHLGIPLLPDEAIRIILESKAVAIDTATINGTPFFCTAGIGFDARVAADYAKAGTRGLATYAKEAVRDWKSYEPGEYVITTESGVLQTRALLITIGNANQWGNDYYITPSASLRDGRLDVAIVKPASMMSNLAMIWQLKHKTLARNKDVVFLKSSFVRIECLSSAGTAAHYDGEVASIDGTVVVECKSNSINIMAPDR